MSNNFDFKDFDLIDDLFTTSEFLEELKGHISETGQGGMLLDTGYRPMSADGWGQWPSEGQDSLIREE